MRGCRIPSTISVRQPVLCSHNDSWLTDNTFDQTAQKLAAITMNVVSTDELSEKVATKETNVSFLFVIVNIWQKQTQLLFHLIIKA
jgi:hypothetical protein